MNITFSKVKIFLFTLFVVLALGQLTNLFAQDIPEKKRKLIEQRKKDKKKQTKTKRGTSTSTTEDSSKASVFSEKDTLATQPIRSNLYWYDSNNKIHTGKERAVDYSFKLADEKKLIYRDMSDIIKQEPLWYYYNLMESGRPAYLAAVNSYPHQTSFYFNGIIMNDPVHGMFNSQYIPLNFIRNVQLTSAGSNLQNFGIGGPSGIHVVSPSRHTKAAWTKVLYKQGNYGYSDLDISLVKPITPEISVQLGGINKVFDGSSLNTDHHGTNYRGEVTWQFKDNLYFRGQFYLNRDRIGLLFSEGTNKPEYPRQIELRDDYFIDMTWLPTDTISERVHVVLFNTFSLRRLKDYYNYYHERFFFKRYGADANYTFQINKFQFLLGGSGMWTKVWGSGFHKNYFMNSGNLYGKLLIPITDKLFIKPEVQFIYQDRFDPQMTSAIRLENIFSEDHKISIGIARSTRFPTATESFFNFDSLFGNDKLAVEENVSANFKYRMKLFSEIGINLSAQYNFISNEIVWKEPNFLNGQDRDFLTVAADLDYNLWKFNVSVGGFKTFSDLHITSRRNGWVKLHFSDIWLNGALSVDAYGTVQYWGEHRSIKYEPRMERFYLSYGMTDSYWIANWKVVATVQEAKIFFEMDNSFSQVHEVITNYYEFTQRWRFGVNWVLWD